MRRVSINAAWRSCQRISSDQAAIAQTGEVSGRDAVGEFAFSMISPRFQFNGGVYQLRLGSFAGGQRFRITLLRGAFLLFAQDPQ